MHVLRFLIFTFLFLPSLCEAQRPIIFPGAQSKKVIGPFDLSDSRSDNPARATIRGFLWENLIARQVAEVKVKFATIEGDPTQWTFSVVASDTHWCIRGDYVSTAHIGLKKIKTTKGTKNYCDVVRVDVRTNLVIPEEELRTPESYRLRLDPAHALEL